MCFLDSNPSSDSTPPKAPEESTKDSIEFQKSHTESSSKILVDLTINKISGCGGRFERNRMDIISCFFSETISFILETMDYDAIFILM